MQHNLFSVFMAAASPTSSSPPAAHQRPRFPGWSAVLTSILLCSSGLQLQLQPSVPERDAADENIPHASAVPERHAVRRLVNVLRVRFFSCPCCLSSTVLDTPSVLRSIYKEELIRSGWMSVLLIAPRLSRRGLCVQLFCVEMIFLHAVDKKIMFWKLHLYWW